MCVCVCVCVCVYVCTSVSLRVFVFVRARARVIEMKKVTDEHVQCDLTAKICEPNLLVLLLVNNNLHKQARKT